jgi:uncharacterized cupredoxin-like copper-binding protein
VCPWLRVQLAFAGLSQEDIGFAAHYVASFTSSGDRTMRNALASAGATCFVAAAFLLPIPATAATIVNIQLQDPSTGAGVQAMHIAVDRDSVPAGKVTFRAVNQSKDQVHELIVVRTDPGQMTLPYDEKKGEVIEKRIRHLGEIADLKPGASGVMTLNLKPGSYLLICNQPGHYKAGMSTAFSVTK